ncbi:MAG: leucine-rich repeat domain-containing protein [Psychrosphaera sp.]|nr:leucine-rich repeat domain-containing protein [Psychrosphaera sp.]
MVYKWSVVVGSICFIGVLLYVGNKPPAPVDIPPAPEPVLVVEPVDTASPFAVSQDKPVAQLAPPEPEVTVVDEEDLKPKVKAGNDFTVDGKVMVELDGYGAAHDRSKVSFRWMTSDAYLYKTQGRAYVPRKSPDNDIKLLDSREATTKFLTPDVDRRRTLTLFLMVTDKDGNWASDSLTITIMPREMPSMAFHELDMPDKGLRKCIADAASLLDMTFTAQLTKLTCKSHNISNLEGIEYLVNLKELSLVDNKIVDISLLSKLSNLEKLNLNRNKVFDLRAVAVHKALYELNLNNNQIQDISPLSELSHLVVLTLKGNQIDELPVFRRFFRLRTLDLSHNYVHSLEPLTFLRELEVLGLANNPFKRVRYLRYLRRLRKLDMSNTENVRCVDMKRLEAQRNLVVTRKGDCRL